MEKNSSLPNFLIVGVARCGTTSLFHYLKQHPQIGFPKIKEPKYFSSLHREFPQKGIGDATVDEKIIRSFDRYQKLFSGLGEYARIGEASSDYFFYHQHSIPAIKKVLGDIPIIISIRNPIERSYSAFNNLVRDGREPLIFDQALAAEEMRIKSGWDWMWAYKQGSLYAEGIRSFQTNFSNVKIVLFEELKKDPVQVLREIERFLDLSTFPDYDTSVTYSPSGTPKNKLIKLISSRKYKLINTVRTKAMDILPRKFLEKVADGFFEKDQLQDEIRAYLTNYFSEDIKKTSALIDRPLNTWIK